MINMKKIIFTFKTVVGCALLSISLSTLQAQGVYLENFDKSVKPQDDFFRYVNGTWLKNAQIPASEGRWGSFNELNDNNKQILKEILEESLKKTKEINGSTWQLVRDFYKSGMDTEKINQLGVKPIQDDLNAIDKIATPDDIMLLIAKFQRYSMGGSPFGAFVGADAKDSKNNAFQIGQGGTGLPDRSYYMDNNEKMMKTRESYTAHIAKMFELSGVSADKAKDNAAKVLAIEKRFAESQRTRVDGRDPQRRYNKKTVDELTQMCFNINWKKYFEALGAKNVNFVLVGQPEFFGMFDRMLKDVNIEDWKVYFKWKLIAGSSRFLSKEFEEESFKFYSTTLRGITEMKPRWKTVQEIIDGSIGDALGQLYVERAFPKEAKAKMDEMIANIKEAFAERIKKLDWMSETTKVEALKKLNAITTKIGYPDKWEDYSKLEIKPDDFIGNLRRVSEFDHNQRMEKIGQPVDRNEWGMTPPTVNAYYSPINNEIAFPAGILQPPFFNFKADDAINYGSIGAVIGHELTHGFDDQGSQYDADGNLKMWWTPEDRAKFEAKAQKIVEQFNEYKVLDSIPVNGKLTLGENIADLGGMTIAYEALQRQYQKVGRPKDKDGFTPEQRFFIGFGQIWKIKARDQVLAEQIKTDPHSPGLYRSNGTLSNLDIFFKAFDVKEGDKMRRSKEKVVSIW